MKNLNAKSVRNRVFMVCAFLSTFLTANAQTGYPQGEGFYASEKRFTSTATYNNSNVRTDSSTYWWTKNGYPINKEYYGWDEDKGQLVLNMTGLFNESEDGYNFTYDMTSVGDEESATIQMVMSFDANGDPQQTDIYSVIEGMPILISTTIYQYWRTDNRIDSIMMTMSNSFTPDITWTKTIFKTYDASGRPTLIEHFQDTGYYSIETNAYITDSSGKLQRIENEDDSYDSYDSYVGKIPPYWITKDITWFDSQERMLTDYYYDGNISLTDYSSYTVYHYDKEAGIVTPPVLSAQPVTISVSNGWISVKSPKAETITIYSISGTQVYTGNKAGGETQISIGNLPQGVYIVKGSSGWVKKIFN